MHVFSSNLVLIHILDLSGCYFSDSVLYVFKLYVKEENASFSV